MRTWTSALGRIAGCTVAALAATGVWLAGPASAASLQQVTNFGTNPSNLRMYVYVPDTVAARPGILVSIHYCTGTAQAMYSGMAREFVTAADRYGYIVVFPEATRSGQCFDVYSSQALTRNGGSDPVGIASMVSYVKQRYNADPTRVFAMGASSGAMMTNVLLGDYPDVFTAGAAFAGVPFGCFATTGGSTWNSECANGQTTKTAQQWGDLARAAYPGYTGRYPRMQLWHGTADDTLRYPNFAEEIKQWTNLNGVSQTPASTDSPQASWTRTRYGSNGTQAPVEGISISGGPHNILSSGMAAYTLAFFGLDTTTTRTTTTTTTTTTRTTPTTTTTTTRPTTPTTTTTTRTTPPTTTTTTSQGSGGCTAAYSVQSQWPGGFVANVNVTAGSSAINGWRVTMTLPSGASIGNLWNGANSGTSGTVTVTNAAYNGRLGAGQTTNFGFVGNGTGAGTTVTCTAT
ncbi:MAG: PHB depolymerase family esterase [Actinomycetales bacterium]|nr:PHB depolymerase family esterase [Actinomycetales bacterium]